MGLKIALAVGLMLVSWSFAAKQAVGAEPSYKTYLNVALHTVGMWTRTDIDIPRGAMVAIMAEGECVNFKNPMKRRLDPSACVRFKIGEKGMTRNLGRFYASQHVIVMKSSGEGRLLFNIAPFLKETRNWQSRISATVLVWEKGKGEKVESDLRDLIRAHPEDKKYQALLFPLATSFTQVGEYLKAEKLLKDLREATGMKGREGLMALNLSADNEKWLRRYDRVATYSQEALDLSRREGYKSFQGGALLNLSEARWNLGQRDEAMRLAQEALGLSEEMRHGSTGLAGRSHQMLGLYSLKMERLPEAIEHCQKSLESLRKARAWAPLAQSYFFLGQAQRKSDRREEAEISYNRSIKIAKAVGRAETLWRAYSELGHLAAKEGEQRKAFKYYAEAIAIIEGMRGELGDPALKALFMENKFQVYEWMIRLLHGMKRDEEAFQYLERAKARTMLDMLGDKTFASKNSEIENLLAKERAVREQIQDLERVSGQLQQEESEEEEGSDESSVESGSREGKEIELLQAEQKTLLDRIEQLNPDLGSLLQVNPLKGKEVQALLDEDTVLLAYYAGSEWTGVFVVTKDKILGLHLEISRKELAEKVKEFRKDTEEGLTVKALTSKDYEKPLTDLYGILIKPVEKELAGKKHLVVVPHGMLHYLPFQALRSPEGKYLIESHTVSYLPSASVLKYAREKNRGNHEDLLAVANPKTDLSPLPAAELEAREVSALFDRKQVLLGPGATETKFKSEGPRYDMLLFSTHGEMIESAPLESNLRFTPTPEDDGKLKVSEIFDMEVKANLVTLSACETGLARGTKGGFPQGDDLVGLSRAFIHAGAPSVVASLWKVSDEVTVQMMRSFYRNLRTMPKAEALQQAQLGLANASAMTSSHPYFWAPFILVGDWK
jgi:CHAT domain-containing protein/tetratricopeptide (TPR) repeat protein